jgi:hypothetical protein
MSWSEKYKKSIDCDNPKGFSQRAHCQSRRKKLKEQLKSFKTVEEIAKKHRLNVSFIQRQLDIGEPIEHEHTKDHELAKEIALQHLDEIPDYYTRLKKMEADAKKHHKKFKDVKEGNLHKWYQDSKSKEGKPGWVNVVTGGTCASDEPGEGTPKCVSSAKRASMTPAERRSASRRKKAADPGQQSKSGAEKPTYVSTDNPKKKMNEEKDIKGKGSGKKDACYHKVKSRYDVWPSAYASGALVKCRKVGANNWGTKSEGVDTGSLSYDWDYPMQSELHRYCPKCKKNESRSECKYGPRYWDLFSLPTKIGDFGKNYTPNTPHPGNMPESKDHEYSMARSEISTIISAAKRLKKKMGKGEGNIEAWVQSKITKAADYLDSAADYVSSGEMKEMKCWKGHKKVGTQKLFGKYYNRCVKKEDVSIEDANGNPYVEFIDIIKPEKMKGLSESRNLKTFHQFMEDWQSANRKDRTDGMSRETVKKYRDENPGSKLQTAVTEKKPKGKRAKRRANFCRRMKGMKSKLTSAKTARDPDSRINKALRRWRCN